MRTVFFMTSAVIGLSSAVQAAQPNGCQTFMYSMRSRVDVVFHTQASDFKQKQVALSKLFEEGVDIMWAAKEVTGTYWNSASEAERQNFVKAYRAYLVNHYIGGLNEDNLDAMQAFEVKDFTTTGEHAYEAHVEITQKTDDPVNVDLRMVEEPAGVCHVRDFTVEGISLIESQRDQIQTLAADGGLPNVTQKLTQLLNGAPSQ